MPLRNRVTPLGELIATPARGLVYGNRGCLHDSGGDIRWRYSGKRWISCRLEFRGRRRAPLMKPGRFTELFFLDEATAFAAGHRPCALCRRADYDRLTAVWAELHPGQVGADAIDAQLHRERVLPGSGGRVLHEVPFDELPDGAFVLCAGTPHLVLGVELLSWTPAGYLTHTPPRERAGDRDHPSVVGGPSRHRMEAPRPPAAPVGLRDRPPCRACGKPLPCVAMSGLPDLGAFGAAFTDFMQAMSFAAEHAESEVTARVRDHLGADPKELPTTAAEFPLTEEANLQLALDAVLGDAEILGFTTRHARFGMIGLAEILAGQGMAGPISLGPVQHTDVVVGDGRVIECVASGVFLAVHEEAPVVLVLSRGGDHPMQPSILKLEGVSPQRGAVSQLLRVLRAAMREHNVFRGRIISLHQTGHEGSVGVQFHAVPTVGREGVILPPGTLERLERHSIGVAENADVLRAGGRHLKRGVLLHGPPGTGKTLSVMYLLRAMPERTTILLTGRGLGLIEQAMAIGRELAPATFVFEDIDLVAAERTMQYGSEGVLFELLNQMEGLAEDEDLLFLLTTNRPDVIEPALAARPGRIDLALEIPLPDGDGRRRLFALYGEGIDLDEASERDLVERSDGVSGAFIKELVRQAWLRGALDGRDVPTAADLRGVLDELLEERATLTRRLLGQHGDDGGLQAGGAFPAMVHALGAAGMPVPRLHPG